MDQIHFGNPPYWMDEILHHLGDPGRMILLLPRNVLVSTKVSKWCLDFVHPQSQGPRRALGRSVALHCAAPRGGARSPRGRLRRAESVPREFGGVLGPVKSGFEF